MRYKSSLLYLTSLILVLSIFSVSALSAFNSPSTCTGQWTSCSNAYADGGSVASAAPSATANKSGLWNGYNFALPASAAVDSVKVRVDSYATKNSGYLDVRVSWDGGATFGPSHIVGGNTVEQTYTVDVSSDTAWTASKVNSMKVNVTSFKIGTGSNPTVNLDWVPVNVTYTPFDFSVAATPASASVVQTSAAQTTVNVTLLSGVAQTVSLSVINCPTGASCSFVPASGTPNYGSILTVSTSSSTPSGVYPINISASGDGKTRYVIYTLTVTDSQPVAGASTSQTSGDAPLFVYLTGSVVGGDAPFNYFWDFKDGSNSTSQYASHTFTSAGTYNVSFTVTDNDGDSSTSYVLITAIVPQTCTHNVPTVSVAPFFQSGNSSDSLIYTVLVTNRDSAACDASVFDMGQIIPLNWSASFSQPEFLLLPGQNTSVDFTLQSDAAASSGYYSFNVTTTNANSSLVGYSGGVYHVN